MMMEFDISAGAIGILPPALQPYLETYLDGTLEDGSIVLQLEHAMLQSEACRDQMAIHHMLHGLSDAAWHQLAGS